MCSEAAPLPIQPEAACDTRIARSCLQVPACRRSGLQLQVAICKPEDLTREPQYTYLRGARRRSSQEELSRAERLELAIERALAAAPSFERSLAVSVSISFSVSVTVTIAAFFSVSTLTLICVARSSTSSRTGHSLQCATLIERRDAIARDVLVRTDTYGYVGRTRFELSRVAIASCVARVPQMLRLRPLIG